LERTHINARLVSVIAVLQQEISLQKWVKIEHFFLFNISVAYSKRGVNVKN
jgi:hypothetical protein